MEDLIKGLLESGVHFGHQTQRWNPKMQPYIFGQRSGIYIIDLEQTAELLNVARDFIRDLAVKGGRVLFIGTKKQAQDTIKEQAVRSDMYYVNYRWLGGLLTNFQTVKKSIKRLNDIEQMQDDGTWDVLTKKEVSRLNKERNKLLANLGGIREMADLPDAVFVVDPKREDIAIREARKLHIPVVAIVDTNCDPDEIDFPIPGNDDAIKSIKFITHYLAQAITDGRKEYVDAGLVIKESKPAEAGAKKDSESAGDEQPVVAVADTAPEGSADQASEGESADKKATDDVQ
jgi:small subunit ribosomal protein S2